MYFFLLWVCKFELLFIKGVVKSVNLYDLKKTPGQFVCWLNQQTNMIRFLPDINMEIYCTDI